jgi:reverse transcriptase-like protein
MDATLLITRALNYVMRQHAPSYLALRLFAESTAKELRQEFTTGYVARKAATKRAQAYWKHSVLKGQDASGKLEYRTFVIGSATAQLAETWLLSRLRFLAEFQLPSPVYSYLWPTYGNSSHLFAHFIDGYRRREHDASTAFKQQPGSTAVILDLKQFYPSINKERVERRFYERLKRTRLTASEVDDAMFLVSQLLFSTNVDGLPVGPALSHVLANVALEDVDDQMMKRFPNAYFRYVDDVILVVPEAQAKESIEAFRTVISAEGLELNDTKTDIVSHEPWKKHAAVRKELGAEGFGEFMRRLQLFLARNPEQFESLRQDFRAEGFSIPFSRLRTIVQYGRFRRFLKVIWKATGWLERIIYSVDSPATLLAAAQDMRANFLKRAETLSHQEIAFAGMERRWDVQQLRYVFNRLLYLMPSSDYGQILRMIPDIQEARDLRIVLEAIKSADATPLLRRPGPPISTFAQLWSERDGSPKVEWPQNPHFAERDSAAALAAYGTVRIPTDWIARVDQISNQRYLSVLNGDVVPLEREGIPPYLQELACLRKGLSDQDAKRLMQERFNNDEDLFLSGLDLGVGGVGYSS